MGGKCAGLTIVILYISSYHRFNQHVCTCVTLAVGVGWPSLSVTGLTHPHRTTAPAPLWYWHPMAGAGMTETLTTRSTMMLSFCLFKHLLTAMTGLKRIKERSRRRQRKTGHPLKCNYCRDWLNNKASSRLLLLLLLLCVSASVLSTHNDLCVGSPVRWCHLVSEPGSDGFGGTGAVLRHWLDHKIHPVEDPLGGILVGGRECVGLKEEGRNNPENWRADV